MTNKKENLLEQLRGSVQSLEHIQESLDGLTIYDERGYVDTVFFYRSVAEHQRVDGCQ